MQSYYMTIVMAVDKCFAVSGRALQVESTASKIQHVKSTFEGNFEKSKQMHEKTVCGDDFATASKESSMFWVSR